ncbi:hypothetical protein PM082_013538 [Marasmius tenuissimus]|nr:hypothetical protein PM082_013538 [Marasmius tenuissimus]
MLPNAATRTQRPIEENGENGLPGTRTDTPWPTATNTWFGFQEALTRPLPHFGRFVFKQKAQSLLSAMRQPVNMTSNDWLIATKILDRKTHLSNRFIQTIWFVLYMALPQPTADGCLCSPAVQL